MTRRIYVLRSWLGEYHIGFKRMADRHDAATTVCEEQGRRAFPGLRAGQQRRYTIEAHDRVNNKKAA